MSLLAEVWPDRARRVGDTGSPYPPEQIEKLRQLGARMGLEWASAYPVPWALESEIRSDARAWSAAGAREVVRHLQSPSRALAVVAWGAIAVGLANITAAGLVTAAHDFLLLLPLAGAGVLVSIRGFGLLSRHAGILRQHRAGIPPLRARLQTEMEAAGIAALDERRTRLAGPRRPIPKHPFEELLPVQAQQIAAGWMRHLGELDAAVRKESGEDERSPAVHVASSGYIGRVWPFEAPVPELELRLLESAAKTGPRRRPLLFSRGPFPDAIVARADRLRVGLFVYDPWAAAIRSANQVAARHLKRGLRDAEGIPT